MADPEPRPKTPLRDAAADLHAILERLKQNPDHQSFEELFDLSSSIVFGWALDVAPDRVCAGTATVGIYSHLWRHSRRYPGRSMKPWSWLKAATVHALHQQQHHGWPEHH